MRDVYGGRQSFSSRTRTRPLGVSEIVAVHPRIPSDDVSREAPE